MEKGNGHGLEKMSSVELLDLKNRIDRLIVQKQTEERIALRGQMEALAKKSGFALKDLFGRGGKGPVAVKFRDPDNPDHTWTGRGRMPKWLTAATGGKKAKAEEYRVG